MIQQRHRDEANQIVVDFLMVGNPDPRWSQHVAIDAAKAMEDAGT